MQLHKTDRARAELTPGVRTLGQRERSLLLLADGRKSAKDFSPLFEGQGEKIALQLLQDGFLAAHPASPSTAAVANTHPAGLINTFTAALATAQATPQTAATSTDTFDGKRSLATTRMFLFDLCERMFTRRDPTQAEAFRDALRCAKDRESMLSVSRIMITHIEQAAGPERADSIAQRIAMLLPVA